MARIHGLSTRTIQPIRDHWSIQITEPDEAIDPRALRFPMTPGSCPGTLVAALRDAGSTAFRHRSPDAVDVWYTCAFRAESPEAGVRVRLLLEGLATLADIWLNDTLILRSENMFVSHEVDVTDRLAPCNLLAIRFRSLNRYLEQRQPRPRWRTHLVDHPNLRWVRTTLLGRMPGWHEWAHTIHAVGPWKPISLVWDRGPVPKTNDIRADLDGGTGVVDARIVLECSPHSLSTAILIVGEDHASLNVTPIDDRHCALHGSIRLPDVARWWPHTHGAPALYPVQVRATTSSGPVDFDFGRTGFRALTVEQGSGDFQIRINDAPVFLRGACWTTGDAATLITDASASDRQLRLAAEAGMNLLRIPGTGFYESDAFYDGCARQGIGIWQDYAFALMDYPTNDLAFQNSVTTEADQLLDRLQLNPALLVMCGNSECEAAAAMHGLAPEQWSNPLFDQILPERTAQARPDVTYVPSSQSGGALPFHVDNGVSHYYGIGAYLRPVEDARRSRVRFATECLGFANIPEDALIDRFLAERETPGRHPSWKAGVPRNVSQGWDFDDVRDHYIRQVFQEDPLAALYSDIERYLALGRAIPVELINAAFSEWRRSGSECRGALVWFFQDLWPAAGWGILDSDGMPKSAYYAIKRAMAPVAIFFTDEGLNGLMVHVINERPDALSANLRVTLYRHGSDRVEDQRTPVIIGPRQTLCFSLDALLGRFVDTARAYRFGPAGQDVTVASLETATGDPLTAPAFFFPGGMAPGKRAIADIRAEIFHCTSGRYMVTLTAERFAQMVRIAVPGYLPEDNYFHLEPGRPRRIPLSAIHTSRREVVGEVTALNAPGSTRIAVAAARTPQEAASMARL